MPSKIIYRAERDVTKFDMDRFLASLQKYDANVTQDRVELLMEEFQAYDPLHVSCLVEVGTAAMTNDAAARAYYEDHISWTNTTPNFERLRRITGYLVGSLERWNDGKRAEERERVKHDVDYNTAAGQFSQDEKDEIEAQKLENSIASQI